MYRASNGITGVHELTDEQAREDYERAQHVDGRLGEEFVTCPVGEQGRVLRCAATRYVRVGHDRSYGVGYAEHGI